MDNGSSVANGFKFPANGKVDVKGKGRAVDQDVTSDDDGQASLHELEEAGGFLSRPSTSNQDTDGFPSRPGGHRARSSSLASLGFAFSGLHIPLTSESIDPSEATREAKHLDLLGCISLVVGLMVGSGIFSSPVSMLAEFRPVKLKTQRRAS